MFVKVCGIKSVEEAEFAVSLGYDALGIVFHPRSVRFVGVEEASRIIKAVKGKIKIFGVFKSKSELNELVDELDYIQIYEPVEELPGKVVLGVSGGYSGKLPQAKFYILDASHGRGKKTFYPEHLWGFPRNKVIISGGLTPWNVDFFIQRYHPFGVDVSSGVELRPGEKSFYLMEEFIRNARRVGV